MSRLKVVKPRTGQNIVVNGSFEIGTDGQLPTGWTKSGSVDNTATISPGFYRYGIKSCNINHQNGTLKIYQDVTLPVSPGPLYFGVWAYILGPETAGAVKVHITSTPHGGSETITASSTAISFTGWQFISVASASLTGGGGKVRLEIEGANNVIAWLDGAIAESYATPGTYFDGSFPGCRWTGASYLSESYRDNGAGGEIYNLSTLHRLNWVSGFGMPPVEHDRHDYGSGDGGYVTDIIAKPRPVVMGFTLAQTPLTSIKSSGNNKLMDERAAIVNRLAPQRLPYVAPATLLFMRQEAINSQTAERELELDVFYEEGLSIDRMGGAPNEQVAIRCTAYDPFFRSASDSNRTLTASTALSNLNGAVMQKPDGSWVNLSTAFSNPFSGTVSVRAVAHDPSDPNAVYIGGNFQTAGGVTSGGIVRYKLNTGTFEAMPNSGLNGAVNSIHVEPNGDVYVAGAFTQYYNNVVADMYRVARYLKASNTWTNLGTWSGFQSEQYAIMVYNSYVYVGGIGGASNLRAMSGNVSYNGVARIPFSSLPNIGNWANFGTYYGTIRSFIMSPDNKEIYATAETGHIGGFGSGVSVGVARIIIATEATYVLGSNVLAPIHKIMRDTVTGAIYIAGASLTLSGVAKLNGWTWVPLGRGILKTGAKPPIYALETDKSGDLLVGGDFTHINAETPVTESLAKWDGYSYSPLDIDLPAQPVVNVIKRVPSGHVFYGFTGNGSGIAGAYTTLNNAGSAPSYPILRFTGPGKLVTIRNETTLQEIYFNYTLAAGEVVEITFHPEYFKTYSSLYGDLGGSIFLGGGNTTLQLAPGANRIYTLVTGGTLATSAILIYRARFWSVD